MREVRLNFAPSLVPLVCSGEKTTTWRINDEKNIAVGDTLLLHRKGDEVPFGRAVVLSVTEKTFAELTADDMKGHERYASTEEMVKTFQGYYGASITLATFVKIIRFALEN